MRRLPCFCLTMLLLCGALVDADALAQTGVKAKPDNPEAQYELAKNYETGTGVEHSLETAIELYEQAARHGHSQSMLRLGVLYYNGDVLGGTIKPDNEFAWLWFTFAAAHGQPQAVLDADRVAAELHPSILRDLRVHAAETLIEGNEVPANVEKGVELCRSAAQDGSAKAAEILGRLYVEGKLVPRDLALAFIWYEKASGTARAAEILGTLYMEGTRVPRDIEQGTVWYEKAAKAGSRRAMYELAQIAETESPPNLARAFELYRKAGLKGHARSMYRVGEMYSDGLGVGRDLVLAHAWFTVAGYFEVAEGKAAARELEARLTREQIEKAQIMAHNLIVSVEPPDSRAPE